jgi:carbamoyl-phosphate synthase large subunit
VDALYNGEFGLVVNTAGNATDRADSFSLRRTTLVLKVPYFTTVSGALAAAHAIATLREGRHLQPSSLQELHAHPGFSPESAPRERVGYR